MSFTSCSNCDGLNSVNSSGTANCFKLTDKIYIGKSAAKDSDFILKVQAAMNEITSKEVGQRLIRKINQGKHIIWIYNSEDEGASSRAINQPMHRIRGVGACTRIELKVQEIEDLIGFRGEKIPSPFHIMLAHELIHGYHNSRGKCRGKQLIPDKNQQVIDFVEIWGNEEEYSTIIGLPSKKPDRKIPKISENAIRQEHGLVARFSYHRLRTGANVIGNIKLAAVAHKVASVAQNIFQKAYQGAVNIVKKNSFRQSYIPSFFSFPFSSKFLDFKLKWTVLKKPYNKHPLSKNAPV